MSVGLIRVAPARISPSRFLPFQTSFRHTSEDRHQEGEGGPQEEGGKILPSPDQSLVSHPLGGGADHSRSVADSIQTGKH